MAYFVGRRAFCFTKAPYDREGDVATATIQGKAYPPLTFGEIETFPHTLGLPTALYIRFL